MRLLQPAGLVVARLPIPSTLGALPQLTTPTPRRRPTWWRSTWR
ncbi:MAG: hypothetical protein ABJA34_01190 [Pseudonocardiales bacterium]